MRGKVLVVDDQIRARRILVDELREAGFEVCEASDGRMGWRAFQEHAPDVVVTDIVMPAEDGLALLERIREHSDVPVILFTSFGTAQSATHAFKAGADDFICADDVEIEDLVDRVANAVAGAKPITDHSELDYLLVGGSVKMKRLRDRIAGMAALTIPVFLSGESGTGKNHVATLLHELGPSRGSKLVALSPESPDLQSDHATSAIYLDRVDELPAQTLKGLTADLDAESRNGFRTPPRIFASTTSRVADLTRDPDFRNGIGRILLRFSLELPALSEIPDDIPQIAEALAARIGNHLGRRAKISPAALRMLREQSWPGNAAQLHQTLERAITFSRDKRISCADLEDVLADMIETVDTMRQREGVRERDQLLRVLNENGGNISRAAESLGKSRAAVYRLIEKHEVPLKRTTGG